MVVNFLEALWNGILWKFQGELLDIQLSDATSPVRTEAMTAIDRVVYETSIPPDCVSAVIVRGGCCIYVKHDDASEACIDNNYLAAADRAIEWIKAQGDELTYEKASMMSRKDRKVFDAKRRKIATKVRERLRNNNVRLN